MTTRSDARTFVLVHGAWHGGWCWVRVADRLQAQGHRVLTPTQTGLGERRHLLRDGITLDLFAQDIANVIETEGLTDIVLVGHSFGGGPISQVAEMMRERIRHLVYLDAVITQPGRSPFDSIAPEVVADRRRVAQETSGGLTLPPPDPAIFGVTDPEDVAWSLRRMTPHPIATYESSLNIVNPVGNGLPRTYIDCTSPRHPVLDGVKAWVRQEPGWQVREMACGHNPMVTNPEELTSMLFEIAEG